MTNGSLSNLRHLHLNPGNFEQSDIYLPLNPNAAVLFTGLTEGKMLCQGLVGEAEAGTFCDLHGHTMFVLTTKGKYYYELQKLGDFEVGDAIQIVQRGGLLVAEKISLDKLMTAEGIA